MEEYKAYLETLGMSHSSIRSHSKSLSYILEWAREEGITLAEFSYTDVLAYVQHSQGRRRSKRTINHHLVSLRHYYRMLQKQELRQDNPAVDVKVRGVIRRLPHHLLSREELDTLYQSYKYSSTTGVRNKVMLGLVVFQGLTGAELGQLEVSQIDLENTVIRVRKSQKSNGRDLLLERQQLNLLREYLNHHRVVLLSQSRTPSVRMFIPSGGSSNYHNMLRKCMRSIQVQFPEIRNLQQLRSSVIVEWLRYKNLREVQYLAGHRYVSSTEAYKQESLEALQKAVVTYHPLG